MSEITISSGASMKSRKTESGSAHLIIIIVLVVIIIGALGFIFWQNFIKAKPAATTNAATTSSTSAAKSTATTPTSSTKSLVVSEWNVNGTYSGDTPLTYTMDHGFLFPTTDALPSSCSEGAGAIQRATADDTAGVDQTGSTDLITAAEFYNDSAPYTAPDGTAELKSHGYVYWAQAHIGTYYYFYLTPQAECSSDDSVNALTTKVIDATTQFVNSISAN